MSDTLARAHLLNQQGRHAEAEALFRQALTGGASKADALAGLAVALFGQGKLEKADEASRDAVWEDPARAYLHYVRAGVLRGMRKFKQAETFAREALAADFYNGQFRAELAWILMAQGRFSEALELTAAGLELNPNDLPVLQAHTEALLQSDRLTEAEASARLALWVNAEDAQSLTNLAVVYSRLGRRDEAVTHLLDALRIDPTFAPARAALVNTLKQRFWFYRAVLGYRKAVLNVASKWNWNWRTALVVYVLFKVVGTAIGAVGGFFMLLFLLFIVITWAFGTITVICLRFHHLGRAALTRQQIQRSNWTGALMLIAFGSLIAYYFGAPKWFWSTGSLLTALVVPISATLSVPGTIPKVLWIPTAILSALGLWSIIEMTLTGTNSSHWPVGLCILGCVVFALLIPPGTFDQV